MSDFASLIAARFDDGGPSFGELDDDPFLGAVLARKTVRQYSAVAPEEPLLELLVAAALSSSAKSDFQQASILRVADADKRAAIGALFPKMPWIGAAPAKCAASRSETARSRASSMPPSTPPSLCKP
jgi:FMN reductase [NAD(P)H]